ncbi:MAG: ketopantoate reductase family protein, partial [Alphaproteobacteria bacterium]|nr:ketopantoate reductase family protein [Alphaproteobacteria bacterium]
ILGAGAVGGYFGGRIAQARNAEQVAFLVRPGRKAQLDRDGLVIESPSAGDYRGRIATLAPDELRPGWDVVILACKAYDLDSAIAAIRPAMDGRAAVLPLLNGMSHLDALAREFGAGQVLGGLAGVQATLTRDGIIRHLAPGAFLRFGELGGGTSERVRALEAAFVGAPVRIEVPADIRGAMWEKLVFLGTLAIATVLMRANLGEITSTPGGAEWLERLMDRNSAIARAEGHPIADKVVGEFRAFVRGNPVTTASMLRDLEGGGRIEADHILGYLLQAARRAGLPDELHEAAWRHAKSYEARREARGSPSAPR